VGGGAGSDGAWPAAQAVSSTAGSRQKIRAQRNLRKAKLLLQRRRVRVWQRAQPDIRRQRKSGRDALVSSFDAWRGAAVPKRLTAARGHSAGGGLPQRYRRVRTVV